MGTLVELRYQRTIGTKRGFYKHTFTTKPSIFFLPDRNVIEIRGGR